MNYIWEAKDFLRHYREYENANKNLTDKLNRLNAELEGYKPIDYSGMPHGSDEASPDDKLCNMIFERDVTKKCLQENKIKIDDCKKILDGLNEEQRKILTMSYIDEQPEVEIIKKLNLSRRTYFRCKGEALRSLARQLFGIKASGY